jgi:hypothetical protein
METRPPELTSEQKNLLQSLARKTGKSVSTLLDEALEGLEKHARSKDANGRPNNGSSENEEERPASVLDIFQPAWDAIPEEELEDLPTDIAAQADHYAYGTPKRPA